MFSEKWHYRFMEVARLIATWSKDPNTKTGAIVVGPDREIRATGYNGLVRGVNDDIPERMERPASFHLSKVRGWVISLFWLYRMRRLRVLCGVH